MSKSLKSLCVLIATFSLFSTINFTKNVTGVASAAGDCFTYALTTSENEVVGGEEVIVSLKYESVTPACTSAEVEGQQFTIDVADFDVVATDFSNDQVVAVDNGDGTLTFTFLNFEETGLVPPGGELTGFGGEVNVTITHETITVTTPVIISDSAGNTVTVTVNPGGDLSQYNVIKYSDSDIVEVGDVVTYTVELNRLFSDPLGKYTIKDTLGDGLSYILGSSSVRYTDGTNISVDVETNNGQSIGLEFNTLGQPNPTQFIYLTYQVEVTEIKESYTNNVSSTINSITEEAVDTVFYDKNSNSWINFITPKGQLKIIKTANTEDGALLEGAEFTITGVSNSGIPVEVTNIVTDQNGVITTEPIFEGTYTLTEVQAPDGFQLVPPQQVRIVRDVITEVKLVDMRVTGMVKIIKLDADNIEVVLPGAEFRVVGNSVDGIYFDQVMTTDASGVITQTLPVGEYTVTEVRAPLGYELDSIPKKVTIIEGETEELLFYNKKQGSIPPVSNPNLVTIKSVNTDAAQKGDRIQYTISVQNTGDAKTTNVKITDTLNNALIIESAETSKGSGQYIGNYIEANITEIEPGETVTLVITALVVDLPSGGIIENIAKTSSVETGEQYSNKVETVIQSGDAVLPNTGK